MRAIKERKKCTNCKKVKIVSDFQKQGKYHSGRCKECLAKIKKEYVKNNKNKVIVARKKYYDINKEKVLKRNRIYYENNREKVNEYHNAYFKQRIKDPAYKLRRNVSRLVAHALSATKSGKFSLSVLKFLPCTIQELQKHLEKQFEPWMNWGNQGFYKKNQWDDSDPVTWKWQLDHIIPQSKLPYISMEDENFKKCWALDNLRPLSAKMNVIKGDRENEN